MNLKRSLLTGLTAASILFAAGTIVAPLPSLADGGTVPTDVQTGINNAQATVQALSPLALAALVVALTPMGAMLTLRFLNLVLSRV